MSSHDPFNRAANVGGSARDSKASKEQPPPIADRETLNMARNLEEKRDDEALQMDDSYFDFILPFDQKKNEEYVRGTEKGFGRELMTSRERDIKSLSSAFEYVVYRRIRDSKWLGDSMSAELTTKYDDYKGIDLYVENIHADAEGGNPTGISMDLALSDNAQNIKNKLRGIKNLLDHGDMKELRYYRPIREDERLKSRDNVPLKLPTVVVGVTKERALQTIRRYASAEAPAEDGITGLIMLYQMERQLSAYARYSHGLHRQKNLDKLLAAARRYEVALAEITALIDAKLASTKADRAMVASFALQDPVTKLIVSELDTLVESVKG